MSLLKESCGRGGVVGLRRWKWVADFEVEKLIKSALRAAACGM